MEIDGKRLVVEFKPTTFSDGSTHKIYVYDTEELAEAEAENMFELMGK